MPLTDIVRRPYALMLTPDNVSDIKAAPALLKRAGRMRYLLGDKGYDADSVRRSLREAGTSPSFLDAATGSEPFATTNSDTAAATSSRTPSAASKASVASLPVTTARRQLPLSRRSRNGCRLLTVNESEP